MTKVNWLMPSKIRGYQNEVKSSHEIIYNGKL